MIGTPHNYHQWMNVLDELKKKKNDEKVLQIMKEGTLQWQSGVAERFAKKLIDCINFRLDDAIDVFQRNLTLSRGRESEVVKAILGLRRELNFLVQVVTIPVLPEKDRKYYKNLIVDQANQIQKSLEDSAKNDRSGKMSSIIRNHKVNTL